MEFHFIAYGFSPSRHQFNQVSSVCFGIIHKTLVRQSHNWEVGCIIQTGCSAVRQRACFGSRMSGVRISPPRPYNELSNLLRHYNHSIISIKSILEFYSVTNSFQNQYPFSIHNRVSFQYPYRCPIVNNVCVDCLTVKNQWELLGGVSDSVKN